MTVSEKIRAGKTYLGIELGSTRIKACLIDDTFTPVAVGSHTWENRFENGYWTYSLADIHNGIRACYADLARDVLEKYGETITTFGAMGISAMMHGYMAFDKNGTLLTPFRTWRNTATQQAAEELTELLKFNIPQRWSIAHLYQAVLNREEHISDLSHINTLAGYIHTLLTGRFEVGLGEASGIFPVENVEYNPLYIKQTEQLFVSRGYDKKLSELLPVPRDAGFKGAYLTEEGARFLDPSGNLMAGIPVCPPEGDAGTGMVATNSVRTKTGNISAGTSIFSMLVLEEQMKGYYPEIDIVTTPNGAPVAMVHCNNCCGELDTWVKMFGEFAELMGNNVDISELYNLLYTNAMNSLAGKSGLVAYNYISAEPVACVDTGHPMYFRKGDSQLSLSSFFKAQLYASVAALKMGMDILFEKENVIADGFTGHGGLFKVKGVAQQILADALGAKVMTMKTAGEGGAWGMALLAAYMDRSEGLSLADFLNSRIFADMETCVCIADGIGADDFAQFMKNYRNGLAAQKSVTDI